MARKVSFSAFESRSARLNKFDIRRRPYSGPSLARGILLMYRRNKTNGTWVLKASDGHGAYWTKAFALADDFEDADGKNVLTFYQAQDAAKKLARGDNGSGDSAPITVDGALTAYKTDLTARGANPYNAEWPRVHLTNALLSKPVALLAATELKKWRDGLLGTMAPATINRLCGCLCAALEQAAQHDKRIQNRDAWEVGLAGLPNAQEARNIILSDDKVREFVAAAYGLDDKFGLLTDTLAVTGARPSQAVRLRVEDLHDHPVRPKLMMPKSAKGGGRNRSEKKLERYSVPITVQLAARLKAAAKGRADHAPLLLQSDGSPWADNPGAKVSSPSRQDRHRYRRRSCRDDVRAAAFVDRPDAAAKCSDQAGGVAAQHQRQDDRKALFEIHHRALRRHLAPRTIAVRVASRRECRRARRVSGGHLAAASAWLNRFLLWPFKHLPT